ncbi:MULTISPECIES: carbonic anhydrase [unclassified Corynebacterium]|uniref:carbonic anhydrase n=1 Tax=unclassified Corynebacterium TaxID=2624378 RepID=UPI0029CA67F0|nr:MULTISPECIES: carbonic anhydrase [unclassified Corynebacterium]WPF65847.1 carbonic anhydrase [Corynebacterium sp. 22KM0430]WPF68340.1 carbonic anhydrase [Corynebacterium sp. 21KM1197]
MTLYSHASPQTVWEALQAGNRRFCEAQEKNPNRDDNRRAILRMGQNPAAVVLACSDSRVPVELIFDVGFGDLFVIRTAGEITDPAVLASLEYAVDGLDVPLIVVMGHESCGAVAAATNALDNGAIPEGWQRILVERVTPSILAARREGRNDKSDYERIHVTETIGQIMHRLPHLREQIAQGEIGVVGLRYMLADGRVETVATHGVS